MTSRYHRGSVVSIEDLLARIRSCVADTAAIVSLTIDVERSGERTVFRLNVQPDGRMVALSAEESASPPPSESQQLPSITSPTPQEIAAPRASQHPSQPPAHTAMDDEEGDNDSGVRMNDEKDRIEADEGDHSSHSQHPGDMETDTSASSVDTESGICEPPAPSHDIRRSARQQHPPDRLAYPMAATPLSATGQKRTSPRGGGEDSTDTEESTDASDDSWPSCSSSSSERAVRGHQRKKHRADVPCNIGDSGDDEQVAVLVMKLKEGYSRRRKELDVESASKQAVLQLGLEILGDGSTADVDAVVYQRCAIKIDLLISVSTAMRMVGYYLRAVLAARLKRTHKTKYVRSARLLLGLKSSADITAYPAFYAFVQQHCPSVAGGVMDIEAWLQEPIFLADIGWLEWRRYLGKPHRWIIDSAMEQFKALLQPPQDWMQRGWVEEYDDVNLGRGMRAVRDISMCTSKGDSAAVAADLGLLPQVHVGHLSNGQEIAPWYRIQWNGGKQQLDAQCCWVGRINHLPMPLSNLKLTNNGKLVQRKPIAAGEALTFDYGVEWWAHRVTGVPWNEWMTTGSLSRRKGSAELFIRMHETVLDYTPLLSKKWDKRLREATSELEREAMMMELWETVAPSDEQDREIQL
jgi:hypothetical protein